METKGSNLEALKKVDCLLFAGACEALVRGRQAENPRTAPQGPKYLDYLGELYRAY